MADATCGAGDQVQSRCTKCRRITRHVVVSVVDDKPVRVQCTACEGEHNYRPPKAEPVKKPRAPRRQPTKASAKAEAIAEEFEAAISKFNPSSATAYSMTASFRARTLIAHSSFGLGLVKRVIPPNKIEVLFRDGIRRLRSAG